MLKYELNQEIKSMEIVIGKDETREEVIIAKVMEVLTESPEAVFVVEESDKELIGIFEQYEMAYKVEEKITADEKKDLEEDLSKLEKPAKSLFNMIGERLTKMVFQSDSEEAYGLLMQHCNTRFNELLKYTNGEENEATDKINENVKELNKVIDDAKKEHGKISKLKEMIGKTLKVIAGAVLGILKFSVKLLGCVGLVVVRTVSTFCSEVKNACKSMSNEYKETFNKDKVETKEEQPAEKEEEQPVETKEEEPVKKQEEKPAETKKEKPAKKVTKKNTQKKATQKKATSKDKKTA